jgi:hypothetical protein
MFYILPTDRQMRDGIFQVSVFNAKTNNALPEAELNGESYVIAEPGEFIFLPVWSAQL